MIAYFRLDGQRATQRGTARQVTVAHIEKTSARQLNKPQPALLSAAKKGNGNGVKLDVSGRSDRMDDEFERY